MVAKKNELAFVDEIKAEKKIPVRIPIGRGNDTSDVTVSINGHIWQIKRGELIEVPESVYMILVDAKYI